MGTLDFAEYLNEVEAKCTALSRKLKKEGKLKAQGHYKSGLKLMGLSIPNINKVSKAGFSFDDSPKSSLFKIWSYIWEHSDYHEVKTLALSFLFTLDDEELLKKWSPIKKWMMSVENWAHADGYSSIIARLFEMAPEKIAPQLKKWNASSNPWERRLSLVGLYYYSEARTKQPSSKLALDFISKLITDEDYYVQKGLGWTLRELGNVEPRKLLTFLKMKGTQLSSTAFTTAVEKVDKAVKEDLKTARKRSRAKSSN